MKKIMLMLFIVAIASVNVNAQDDKDGKKSPEERAEMMIKKMTKELTLTADQQAKIKTLILKNEREKEARKKEEKARKERMHEEMKAILTAEQFKKIEQKRNEKKKDNPKKKMPPPPAK